jgi:hypothetical protein
MIFTRRPLLAPSRTWFWIFDKALALADAWLARRERRG